MNPNLEPSLRKVVDATKSAGHVYLNPKAPVIRALNKEGFIEGFDDNVDPDDAAKIMFRATAAGIAALPDGGEGDAHTETANGASAVSEHDQDGLAFMQQPQPAFTGTPQPAQQFYQPQPQPAFNGTPQPFAPQPQPAAKKPKVARGPRAVPIIAPRTAFRFTTMPEGVKRSRGAGGGVRESYPFSTLAAPDASGFDSFFVPSVPSNPQPFRIVRSAVNSANKRMEAQKIRFTAVEVEKDAEYNCAGVRVLRTA